MEFMLKGRESGKIPVLNCAFIRQYILIYYVGGYDDDSVSQCTILNHSRDFFADNTGTSNVKDL